jgi:hypothetical protein
MRRVTGAEALKAIAKGDFLVKDDIFYRYRDEMREFLSSPDHTNWTSSHLTINDIVNNEWIALQKKKQRIRP